MHGGGTGGARTWALLGCPPGAPGQIFVVLSRGEEPSVGVPRLSLLPDLTCSAGIFGSHWRTSRIRLFLRPRERLRVWIGGNGTVAAPKIPRDSTCAPRLSPDHQHMAVKDQRGVGAMLTCWNSRFPAPASRCEECASLTGRFYKQAGCVFIPFGRVRRRHRRPVRACFPSAALPQQPVNTRKGPVNEGASSQAGHDRLRLEPAASDL